MLSYVNKKVTTNRNNNKNNLKQNNTDKEEAKIPIANKAISNRISKLNLEIFTTNKKDNNKSKDKIINSIIGSNDLIIRRNGNQDNIQENQERIINGIDNDNIINGISRENMNIINDNNNINIKKNDEEINNLNLNNNEMNMNYRRLNTDLFHPKTNSNRNIEIKNNKNIPSNTNRDNNLQKEVILSNTIDYKNNINKAKKIKNQNQYPLFFNKHNHSLNNDNSENTNNNKVKKANKLLIKNLSNSRVKIEKKKQKDILNNNLKYLDVSYFTKFNSSLNKTNNNNYTTTINDDKLNRGLKPPLPMSNIHKKSKQYNQIINDINLSYNKNNNNNINTKKQYYNNLKYMNNPRDINNNTINININTKQNSDNLNFDENDNDIFYNNFFDDDKSFITSNNELKKLLEKNVDNSSPNYKSIINTQKIFAQGIMESFCYFKILDKDSPKFNPLDSCAMNPESLGYSEGYISIDVILGHLKIIPKKTASDNFKLNNNFINNRLFNNNFDNDDNNVCIRIELKEINGVKIKKHMQDIMKIHKIFLKYNSHSGMEYEDNNGRIKKRVLSINKLIYMKEITEINMDQNEKIKAALCNFFAFTLIFGKNKINKVECIFINYEQFNIWNKCLETIAENNNKSKSALISSRGLIHRKYNSNNNKNYANGSGIKDNYIYNN